jgi:hypothetical protein
MSTEEGNGRVTMALLGERLNHLIEQNDHMLKAFEKHTAESYVRDTRIAVLESNMGEACKKVDKLETRINSWSLINSLGAGIAAILGYLGINK